MHQPRFLYASLRLCVELLAASTCACTSLSLSLFLDMRTVERTVEGRLVERSRYASTCRPRSIVTRRDQAAKLGDKSAERRRGATVFAFSLIPRSILLT